MKYLLNRKSLERLRALVRGGEVVDTAWSFTADDSNRLLGTPPNWTEYQQYMLGIGQGVPTDGAVPPTPAYSKDDFAYPFTIDGHAVNLAALAGIVKAATAAGDNDIAGAAAECLATARANITDAAKSAAIAPDIALTGAANIRAAGTTKSGSLPTFNAEVYTGGPMDLKGFDYPVIIDLDGMDFTANSRPVLRDHDEARPLGHTTSVAITGDYVLRASGPLSASGNDVNEVVIAALNGFPWQVSVGAKTLEKQFVPIGTTAQANGKTWPGPVIIARRTSLREISILTLGADDNTSATIAAKSAKKGHKMALKKKFAAWARSRNIAMADMEDDGMASAAKALYKAQMKCEADDPGDSDDDGADDGKTKDKTDAGGKRPDIIAGPKRPESGEGTAASDRAADHIAAMRKATLDERKRLFDITAMLDTYRVRVKPEIFGDIEAKAITGVYDANKAELELIRAARPITAANINTGKGGAADGAIIAAAACRSAGVSEKFAYQGLGEKGGNIAASMRGMSLHKIIAQSAGRLGMHLTAGGIDDDFLERFMRADKESHRQQLAAHRAANPEYISAAAGAGFATMSLTGITENILNKAMLEQYGLQPNIIPDIAFERDTSDFKPFKVYRLTAAGDFQPVGPTGELKALSLQDESYANQVATKGVLLILKREDIINDDMGALMQSPQLLGRKASLNIAKSVITSLLSGLSTVAPGASIGKNANTFDFFSAGAKNYMTGSTSALSITSVQTARQKFLQQTDANGDPVSIQPDRLLISPENEGVADNLFSGANLTVQALALPTSGAQSAAQTVNLNQHKGKYRPVMSPFLGGASSVVGASATQWAMLCNPAGGFAAVQVGYLRGQRTPIIRQVETDAQVLGAAYQAIFDFGVSLLDYRCAVYSAGA